MTKKDIWKVKEFNYEIFLSERAARKYFVCLHMQVHWDGLKIYEGNNVDEMLDTMRERAYGNVFIVNTEFRKIEV